MDLTWVMARAYAARRSYVLAKLFMILWTFIRRPTLNQVREENAYSWILEHQFGSHGNG
jgi:hypothetical protein